MKLTYDETADALYVRLSDAAVSRTEQLEPGTLVDLDRFGALVGLEVIRPARTWLEIVLAAHGEGIRGEDQEILRDLFAPTPNRVYTFARSLPRTLAV